LTSLGARRIGVQEIQGQTQEKEQTDLAGGAGFTHARSEESQSGAMFEAEYPGSQKPVVPEGLCWYADEPTWQMIANARIVSGAQKTSLIVMYTTNYGIDTRVVKAAGACGIDIGGRFEEQRDTIWRLDAEFPGPAD
ncbi:MAG TPA: hypothetical protein VEF71_19185, partial [Streptosporangiaceae bacterium]|nr:hypothetical protein [Streptosporangiaceae bacterium]